MTSNKVLQSNSIVLSVILPLYNDKSYIRQCIESVLQNNSKKIELIISDDHSFDGSLEICKEYNDERIKIIKPINHLGAFKNEIFGIKYAVGEYIYILAGDDYLQDGILDLLINDFDGESIYTAPMSCFDDRTKVIFEKQQYPNQYIRMFEQNGKSFISNYLNYYNHDELNLNFIPRSNFINLNRFMENSVNSVFWFLSAAVFHNNQVKNIKETVLFKRYNHSHERSNWKNPQRKISKLKRVLKFLTSTHIFKSFCDIYNSFILAKKLESVEVLLLALFRNRRIVGKTGGLFGLFPSKWDITFYRPNVLIEFLLSPIIMLNTLLKFIFK